MNTKHLLCIFATWLLSVAMYAENVTLTLYAKDCGTPNIITCPKGQQLRINAVDTYGYHFTQWSDGNTSNHRLVTVMGDATYLAKFTPNQYTITTSAINGTVTGGGTYDYDTQVTLTATANNGYHFTQWSDGNTTNPRTITIKGDTTYTAQFAKNTYSITQTAINGSISGPASSRYLDTISLTANPNYGYHFVQWSDGNTDNPRTFVITKDTTFTAQFTKNLYTITTAVNDPVRGVIKGDTTVEYLETISISAIANYGYHFTRWSDGNTNNPRQVQVTENKTYTAQFDKNTYSITQTAINGSISGPASSSYLDTISLTAIPNYGYHFVQWSDGNTDNPRTFVITKDTTFTAQFAKNLYTITTAANDSVRGIKGDTTVEYLETISISAIANYGYHFTQWNDGNANNPRQVQVTENKTYTAKFDKNTYSVSTIKEANIVSITGSGTYSYLDEIVLSATANVNYQFDHWSDGNTDNPRTLIVTQDTSLTAFSSKIRSGKCGDELTWQYNNGTLVISGDREMYEYSQSTMPWVLFKDSIKTISVPSGCTHIGDSAFSGCIGITSVQWNAKNCNAYKFGSQVDTIGFGTEVENIPASLCENMTNLTSLVIPRGVRTIATKAFAGCTGMQQIDFENGVVEIGDSAFFGLTNKQMKTITLPNSVETIGKYAFANCNYLKTVTFGASTNDIANYAFVNDERLLHVNCYAMEPPLLQEDAFVNYDVYLNVPCEVKDEYKVAKGWKLFNKENVSCIGAEETTITDDEVAVNPQENDAAFTWPTNAQAASYSLQITKDGTLFCTLTFNANGQLIGLAFAPGRGGAMEATEQAAILTANGFRFTVTGLNEGTHYAYTLDVKNASGQEIKSYTGSFRTQGGTITALEETLSGNDQGGATKFVKDGVLYILRDGKIYNAQGLSIGEGDR